MGFVRRLNSRDLVNDPCNGAEVYPITATNAVYREGSGENLETILSRLGNSADRKVVQDISYESTSNKLHKEFTDNTTEDITLPNWIKNVTVTNSGRTYTITVTPTTGNVSTYQITLPEIDYPVTDVKIHGVHGAASIVTNGIAEIPDFPVTLEIYQSDTFINAEEGMTHHITGTTARGNDAVCGGSVFPPRLVTQGNGNAITRLSYSIDTDTTKPNRLNLNVYKDNFITDVQIRGKSAVNNNIANMDIVKNNNSIHAIQYVSSEAAYQSMTKDPNTLYFIPVE
jgi:hypothetical protein